MPSYPIARPRRLRSSPWVRALVRESKPSRDDLVWAMVVSDRVDGREPVPAMPGVDRLSVAEAAKAAKEAAALGIPALALFPNVDPAKKDNFGSEALKPDNLV
ncbi:MAG: porphobilinogen synthase, partial [Maricaulaceae bacterium]